MIDKLTEKLGGLSEKAIVGIFVVIVIIVIAVAIL